MVFLKKKSTKFLYYDFLSFSFNIIKLLGNNIIKLSYINDNINFEINENSFKKIILFLKLHYNFNFLTDIACTDFLEKKNRFCLNYNLVLLKNNFNFFYGSRINIFFFISEKNFVYSLSNIYKSSNWLEREIWDFFGIFFYNHTDLRRILTDYGFSGFPFRKDFPLSGYIEVRYDDEKKRILYESIEFSQEFRIFNFINPWNNIFNLKK